MVGISSFNLQCNNIKTFILLSLVLIVGSCTCWFLFFIILFWVLFDEGKNESAYTFDLKFVSECGLHLAICWWNENGRKETHQFVGFLFLIY
jgi:hypothetical protein